MIDMKQLLADREAGTQGPWIVTTCIDYQVEAPDSPETSPIVALCGDVCWPDWQIYQPTWQANAKRIARVPELEQALIDAHAALEAAEARANVAYLAGYYQAECGLPAQPLGNDGTTIEAQLTRQRDKAQAALTLIKDAHLDYIHNDNIVDLHEILNACMEGLGESYVAR